MKKLERPLAVGALLALATCCPGIWFTVTRIPGPPSGTTAGPAELESRPIQVPLRLENRFDLFEARGEEIPKAALLYQDQIDTTNAPKAEIHRVLRALNELIASLGSGGTPDGKLVAPRGPYQAAVSCPVGDRCQVLEIAEQLPSAPWIASITLESVSPPKHWLVGVSTCEGRLKDDDGNEVTLSTVEGPCGKISPAGTMIYLTAPLTGIAATNTVKVSFATDVLLAPPLFTFVHLSDAQIRDAQIKLGDPELSARLDLLIKPFEHDEDQSRHVAQMVQAVVARINAEVPDDLEARKRPEVPRLVIHTGDSVDAGTLREMDAFHEIMDRLEIPWFNAIGNHDILVFGNLMGVKTESNEDASCVSLKSVAAPYPIPLKNHAFPRNVCVDDVIEGEVGSRDKFIAGESHEVSRDVFMAEHIHGPGQPLPRLATWAFKDDSATNDDDHCKSIFKDFHSTYHGFDLRKLPQPAPAPEKPPKFAGYYAFATPLAAEVPGGVARNAIFIVLNTEDLLPNEGGNAGRLQHDQLKWFGQALGCTQPTDLVFIAGHHQLSEIKLPDKSVLRSNQLMQQKNIVAYVYGHNHKHGICRDKGSCGQEFEYKEGQRELTTKTYFWELETGSLLERPQEGRLVRIKHVGGDLAYIETVTFTDDLVDRGSDFAREVELAKKGAERDHCITPGYVCSEDGRLRRDDGRHTSARLFFRLPNEN